MKSIQLTFDGLPANYHCRTCPFTAPNSSDLQKHIKKNHSKQYKKCKTRKCHNMILNNQHHRFCTSCLIKFECEFQSVYPKLEIKMLICNVCKRHASQHSFEDAEKCVETFADELLSQCKKDVIIQ